MFFSIEFNVLYDFEPSSNDPIYKSYMSYKLKYLLLPVFPLNPINILFQTFKNFSVDVFSGISYPVCLPHVYSDPP